MTTPTKPTINQILINCHVWYECPCRDCEKSLKEAKSQLLQLVLDEVIGDRKSVQELEPFMSDAINDFANKVCFKEGYNQAIKELSQRAREVFEI